MALSDDWSYQLAQSFLTAATSCGFSCGRVFVHDGPPEGMPPDCPCQLVASVTEGWGPLPKCGARRLAEVRLYLDACIPVAGQTEVPDPAAENVAAQANAAARWQIMRGLRDAWRKGLLSVDADGLGPLAQTLCARVTPGSWRLIRSGGGSARWETLWLVTDER